MLKILFVCSQNQWRSPTAEQLLRRIPGLAVRSGDLAWADLVLVMEAHHKQRLRSDHPQAALAAKMHVLEIPDDYQYMAPELVQLLEDCVPLLIQQHAHHQQP